jgi:hypothetical protein
MQKGSMSMVTTLKTIAVSFSDRSYQLSHMRAPRGRGSWAFLISGSELPMIWSPSSMTYTEAKAWAKTKVHDMQRTGAISACVTSLTLATQP